MKKGKKNRMIIMFAAGLCMAMLIGCGSEPAADVRDAEAETQTEETVTEETDEVTEQDTADAEEQADTSTEEGMSDEAADAQGASEDDALYEQFIKDEVTIDGEKYSEIFSFMTEDFGQEPLNFYYDVDEDGKDELLVSTLYYGYYIYDVRDGGLVLLDCGDGTAAACGVYKANGHVYVSHSDFSHAGRQLLRLDRYDGNGEIVETIELNVEYWDDEDDMYDENSDFTYNGQKITMQEYEDYMNALEFIDPDSEDARPAP